MIRKISLIILLLLSQIVSANQMFAIDPTSYVVSGLNESGENAYSIDFLIERSQERTKINSIQAKIYDLSIEVSEDILGEVYDPKFDRISAVSDSGFLGSYVSIRIPFGTVGKCKSAKRNSLTKILYISNLSTMQGGEPEVKIIDPCRRQQ